MFKKLARCRLCKNKLTESHELQIDAADGMTVLKICEECADLIDSMRSDRIVEDDSQERF